MVQFIHINKNSAKNSFKLISHYTDFKNWAEIKDKIEHYYNFPLDIYPFNNSIIKNTQFILVDPVIIQANSWSFGIIQVLHLSNFFGI